MNIPASVRNYLARSGGQYKVRTGRPAADMEATAAAVGIAPQELVKATVLRDGNARLMVLHPLTHTPDLERLEGRFKRRFAVCDEAELARLFPGCSPRAVVPLGPLFGIKTLVDPALEACDALYFAAGCEGVFIRASLHDFLALLRDPWRGHSVSVERDSAAPPEPQEADSVEAVKARIRRVSRLPAMPGIAVEIIRLRNNPYSNPNELAAVINQDPSLAAQLLRYASSSFYGYQGKVESVEQAIVRVLGMDFVMDFAFGLALGRPFRNPKEGPLGLEAFWRHAIFCASVAQALCNAMEYSRRPAPGIAYLAGLLHNFGILLVGHLFPSRFERLNRLVAEHPERSLLEIEQSELGVTHTEIGLWLMEAWEMPPAIVEAVREHHNPEHESDFSVYTTLITVANQLLRGQGLGDETSAVPSPTLLRRLGLSRAQVDTAFNGVMASRDGLDFMARKMAA